MTLRARFTLWFSGAALVPIVATAALAWWQISSGYRETFEQKLSAAHDDAQREFGRIREAVTQAAAAAGENPIVGAVLVDLRKHAGELSPAQRQDLKKNGLATMQALGLQVLTIVDREDTVLAAPHLVAWVDENDAEPRRLARARAGAAVVGWQRVLRDGKVVRILCVEAARSVRDEAQEVTVLVGREVGENLVAPLKRAGVEARLVDPHGRVLYATTPAWGPLEHAPGRELVLADEAGQPIARLIVAVANDELLARLRELAFLTTAVGAAATLAAALLGFLVARRMTRDLDALVGGVMSVAAGDLDTQVAVRSRDELGAVAQAFNRMTRELLESKDKLLHAERVAAWQDIAKNLAHEIKNPLTPIRMSVETMRKTHAAKHASFDEIFDESTRTVLEEVERLRKIVGEFSQFARLPSPERRTLDVNSVVASALSLYHGSVRVVKDLGDRLPHLDADRDQLTQVVLNLLENARDAVASKGSDESVGRITVRTRARASAVELEVEDNGPGFDPAFKERIFAPYFTTKESGTGLGLAIVRRIVTEHGGRVSAHAEPGKGARFVVELPF